MKDISKKIILDEIIENSHFENIEHVIFWALEHYYETFPERPFKGTIIAFNVVQRILEAEEKGECELQNPEIINKILKHGH